MSFFSSYIESREKDTSPENYKEVKKVFHASDLQAPPRVYLDPSETVNLMLSAKRHRLAIPKKKIFQNLIFSSMYEKVQVIINTLRLKGPWQTKVQNIAYQRKFSST